MILTRIGLILLTVTFWNTTLADPLPSAVLRENWSGKKLQALKDSFTEHFYKAQGYIENHYVRFSFPENSRTNPLIIVTGAEDPVPLWFNTALEFQSHGFRDIYIVDIRGQGQSDRVPGNTTNALHLDDFNNYYLDLVAALKDIDSQRPLHEPAVILSHSTGSLVVGMSLEKIKASLPDMKIAAMAFWTPLFKLPVSPLLDNAVVRPLVSGFEKLYRKCCGLLLAKKYEKGNFEGNNLTSDRVQFDFLQKLKYDHQLGSSGASLRWALNALEETKKLRSGPLKTLKIPTMVFFAETERVVDNNVKIDNSVIMTETISRTRHALHQESPDIRIQLVDQTMAFFLQHFGD